MVFYSDFSLISRPKDELDQESDHGRDEPSKCLVNGFRRTKESPNRQQSESRIRQRQAKYRELIQSGYLLLSLITLYMMFFGLPLPRKINHYTTEGRASALHFSVSTGAHSVPIGLFLDDKKLWHLYFPNTSAPVQASDCASLGHAVSFDLYTWRMQPIASQGADFNICGGSVVVDVNNTSGFFPEQSNGVVALYTQYHSATRTLRPAIAYSVDGGYTFIKYSKHLILPSPHGDQDLPNPKVIWHEPTQRWAMAAAKATFATIGIYTSPNLIEWEIASEFTNHELAVAGHRFEYPNLVSIPRINTTGAENPNYPTVPGGTIQYSGDYILVTSSSRGSPLNGGSVTRYFPGKFNGTRFEPISNRTDKFIDFGPDNYANQFFFGLPDEAPVVSLGLATNLRYTMSTPARRGLQQTSTFTIPREGYLIHEPNEGDLSYFSRPVDLDSLRSEILVNVSTRHLSDLSVSYDHSEAVLIEMRFEMQPLDDDTVELNVDFILESSKNSEKIFCTTVFRTWTADFGCDRNQAISNGSIDNALLNQMSARQIRPLLPVHNPAVRRWEVQVIVDGSILEVFLNDGVKAGTTTIFAEPLIDSIRFRSSQIPKWGAISLNVQKLRPTPNSS